MEHLDVLIVGAGLSGVGAACHLQSKVPHKRYAILEARSTLGGTWDLFRYPGIRSDSDMHTLGYSFRPWHQARSIADGTSIREYIRTTAAQFEVDRYIRYRHRVIGAAWSTHDARWTVDVERSDLGTVEQLTCTFLFVCSGYYRYDRGYTPRFEGLEQYRGRVVHPQQWPEALDYADQRVVIIGSGATAMTLAPAMAERAAHVTLLQRSPTYVVSLPAEDPFARLVRRVLPGRMAHALVRWKNILLAMLSFQLSRRLPSLMKARLRSGLVRALPAGYPIDPHFRPHYDPWDQRLCVVPDGDLFASIHRGRLSIVTDHIARFTEQGIQLASGQTLEAELVVTATGLNLLVFGGMTLRVDGSAVHYPESVSYKGMMLCGVPNFAYAFGYTNASWTLKVDLVCDYVTRLLRHMDTNGFRHCTPRAPGSSCQKQPLLDLRSGYVLRDVDNFPKQGTQTPWRLHQNYIRDILYFKLGSVTDPSMAFG